MNKLNRRDFIALTAAAPVIASPTRPQFAYVGSSTRIDVFSVRSQGSWTSIQSLQSSHPAFLLFNRSGSILFAANAVGVHQGVPRSTVASYNVHPITGALTLRSTQALSMSAVGARHLALTPDEAHLVVTAFGGGAYNVLPVSQNDAILPPVHILKEAGCSVHPELQSCAHPHSLAYHPGGHHLLASDFGRDCLSVFEFDAGRLRRLSCCPVSPGDGPAAIAFAGNGTQVVVLNSLSRSLSLREFSPSSDTVGAELSRRSVDGAALLVDGDYAYVGGDRGITTWRIGEQEFALLQSRERERVGSQVGELALTPDREAMVSVGNHGYLHYWPVDRKSGAATNASLVARIASPMSIAFRA